MAALNPFTPGTSWSLSVSATSTSASLTSLGGDTLRICNVGTADAFINFGTTTATAVTATNMCVPGDTINCFTIPGTAATVAAVSAAGETTTLRFTRGWGQI